MYVIGQTVAEFLTLMAADDIGKLMQQSRYLCGIYRCTDLQCLDRPAGFYFVSICTKDIMKVLKQPTDR